MLSIIYLNAESIELTGDKSTIKINGSFEIKKISSEIVENKNYKQIKISGCHNSGRIGEVELPVYAKLVSLPET
ncbi:MAG: hypothetical protein KAW88_09110, partial [Candidatus Cloacimonetes bacterium]|nr:hypothetical protein [Candidatus Cloacimonadota bacterium]